MSDTVLDIIDDFWHRGHPGWIVYTKERMRETLRTLGIDPDMSVDDLRAEIRGHQ